VLFASQGGTDISCSRGEKGAVSWLADSHRRRVFDTGLRRPSTPQASTFVWRKCDRRPPGTLHRARQLFSLVSCALGTPGRQQVAQGHRGHVRSGRPTGEQGHTELESSHLATKARWRCGLRGVTTPARRLAALLV
jgi:hypothetical protein